jgi:hypothetical protein
MVTERCSAELELPSMKGEIMLRQKSAFSVQHMMAAARFSRMCGEIETANQGKPLGEFYDHQIACVSATVMLSIASLESNINEYLSEPNLLLSDLPGKSKLYVLELIESKPILEKYQYVLSSRCKQKYPTGEPPYQDVDALVKLRNAMVHFKPEWHDKQVLHKKIESRLKGRFEINPFIGKNGVFFPQQCMSYGCTKWAVSTAVNFMRNFSKRAEVPFRFEKFIERINPETK